MELVSPVKVLPPNHGRPFELYGPNDSSMTVSMIAGVKK